MAATTLTAPHRTLTDTHSVLLWQTCAYADELIDTAQSRRPLTPAINTMFDFLHYRLLLYLGAEDDNYPASASRRSYSPTTTGPRRRGERRSRRTRRLLTRSTAAWSCGVSALRTQWHTVDA